MTQALVIAPARALVIDLGDPRYHTLIPLDGDEDPQVGEIVEVPSSA